MAPELPGRPHLVFPKYKTVIFSCHCIRYLHAPACPIWEREAEGWATEPYYVPGARAGYRELSIVSDVLRRRGWTVRTLWSCEAEDDEKIDLLLRLIGPD
jgi:G:T-mismatch repair DNA endonuclease (very short patch repair protein)